MMPTPEQTIEAIDWLEGAAMPYLPAWIVNDPRYREMLRRLAAERVMARNKPPVIDPE